jgi:hypothetical protein
MSALRIGGMVIEVTEPLKKKKAPRDVHPKNPTPDYKYLQKLFPHYDSYDIRTRLDSLRRACLSNETRFVSCRREAFYTRQRGLRKDRQIENKQRLTKADFLYELFLIRWELDRLWDFLQHKSKEDYPTKPLPVGEFTFPQASY